jgi:molybdopterin synthase sulfur carrier subunit
MAVRVRIPTPLRRLTNDQAEVTASGQVLREVIDDLDRQFPGMKARLCNEDGTLRRFINIYVNKEDVRFLSGEDTPIKDGDEISIIPAMAGGCR